jgi:thiol-disulfide isomerase/thioredoxin
MKRKKQKNRATSRKKTQHVGQPEQPHNQPSRREFINKIRNAGIATVVVGGGGWLVVDDVRATMLEHDLSRIGNGIPSIVQIHDPQCPTCMALQREVRDAMCEFEGQQLQYLVANIRQEEGRKLATTNGVAHVTLLLFDKNGRRRDVLVGPNQSDYLKDIFRLHVKKYGDG